MRRCRSLVCVWAAITVALGGCPSSPPIKQPLPAVADTPHVAIVQPSGRATVPIVEAANGVLTASFPDPKASLAAVIPAVLSPAETQALLARLEPMPAVDNAHAPVVRPPSIAPPPTGTLQPIAFVTPTGRSISDKPVARPPAVASILATPDILPTGEVRAESELRIRFDEPMVPVAKIGPTDPIATIEPPTEGTWRWIDTRVAGFFPKAPRFAQATDYKITVVPTLKAVSGAALGGAATGAFSTPPTMISGAYPKDTQRPDAPIAVQFDQEIDPVALAKLLHVDAFRKTELAFTTITLAEAKSLWARNPQFVFDEKELGTRFVIIAPKTAWPPGLVRVTLPKGAPSKEGPRLSKASTTALATIAQPFKLRGFDCDYTNEPKRSAVCSVRSYLSVSFTNALDRKTYHSNMIKIENAEVEDNTPSSDSVSLSTPDEPVGRTHRILVSPDITDLYGQHLAGSLELSFTTSRVIYQSTMDAQTGLYILDPRFEIPQWVVNNQATSPVHIQLFKVEPADYFAWQQFETGSRAAPPGKRVFDKAFPVGARFSTEARIDLRPALTGEIGHVVAVATADPADGRPNPTMQRKLTAWIEVTKLGVVARVDQDKANVWVEDISPTHFLSPLGGATASLLVEGRHDLPAAVTTDAIGHASFELPAIEPIEKRRGERSAVLIVKSGADAVFATITSYEHAVRERNVRWYVTDDRFMYKPGEPIYMKGWVRWTHTGVNPGLELPPSGDQLEYTLVDARQNKIASGTAAYTEQGGFDFKVDIPANANLGRATFNLRTKNQTYAHPIDIQEFRTPAYAVNLTDDVTAGGAAPLILGESIEMNAEAKYYSGGGLAGAAINWSGVMSNVEFRPPGWDQYTFNPVRKRDDSDDRIEGNSAQKLSTLSGASSSSIVFGISALPAGEPAVLNVDAVVTDLDRATIRASSRPILIHPSSYYVGMRLQPETIDTLQLVVTDIDGNLVPGVAIDVELEATLYSEARRNDAKIADTQRCHVTSATTPVPCKWTFKDHAHTEYRAIARIADARGRKNATAYFVPYWRTADSKRDLDLTSDRPSYKPGEVAKLAIHSAAVPATALVSVARQGVVSQQRVELAKEVTTVDIPIELSFIQNVHVVVDRSAKRDKTDPKVSKLPIPAHAETQIDLQVDVEAARLVMRTHPTKPLVQPGEDATFEVEVKHADRPVAGAEVALIVVDEAVLALSQKHHADPLAPFYRAVGNGTWGFSTLNLVRDADRDLLGKPGFDRIDLDAEGHGAGTGTGYGYGAGAGGMSGHSSSMPSISTGVVTARKDFRATAVFSPRLVTDLNGKVSITVKMPDSLTRFRVVALASSKTYFFGKAESTIVTQRKINARTVAPRFLTQGDRFELPVVVQNLDSKPRTIDVAVRAANLVPIGSAGQRVTVPAGQRAEVRFGFATQARGKVVIQTIATSNDFADASNVELPVYEPATTEAFATYGIVDDQPKFERLDVPADIFPDVGGIETEVSSTQLQALTDAYWYLYAYPYECAEQRSSRMLATSAMSDILIAFNTPGRPTVKEIDQQRTTDLQKLREAQAADGGWGYWRDLKSDPFVTMQVLQALAAANDTGPVVQKAIGNVSNRVTALFAKLDAAAKPGAVRSTQEGFQVSLAATGLAALAAAGVDERAAAQRLHVLAVALHVYPVDAKARLLALVAKLERAKPMRDQLVGELLSATHETAAGATVAATYADGEKLLLVSNARTTALVLDALIREVPEHALIPKLARGLLAAKTHGRWRSTQENLAAMRAMRRYFDTYEKDTPNYTGKLWVGTAAYAEQAFVGRSNARGGSHLDWLALVPGTSHDITLQKAGPGRMYYRIGITYAPKRTDLPALDAGFIVRRSYEAVDDPHDVVKTKDGWDIRLGAKVLVVLETVTSSPRDAVALVDPLPAGLEAVNTSLATSERTAAGTDDADWDHIEMRDNRSEAFAMLLREGTHRFSYTARATTPGTFIAAPTKAEEMYAPETFGRSVGATVTIR